MSSVIGSVIEGTLRTQDLLPRFLDLLRELNPELWMRWTTPGYEEYVRLPSEANDPWWDGDEATDVLSNLIEALDDLAPPRCYFGSHFGNSSDFGFWPL